MEGLCRRPLDLTSFDICHTLYRSTPQEVLEAAVGVSALAILVETEHVLYADCSQDMEGVLLVPEMTHSVASAVEHTPAAVLRRLAVP